MTAATADLITAHDTAATTATQKHWTAYLKGAATFRGVPMAGVRAAVGRVWRDHHLADRDGQARGPVSVEADLLTEPVQKAEQIASAQTELYGERRRTRVTSSAQRRSRRLRRR
ncbi:hypothetical protein [Micromonospora echinofusca]|uniref:Uncharacterized protein n=1 Tax=Micromonospora echinofusca TaxID=47858 RepID=A0ABS3VJU6_MICEH|nr:hypothetical protein [Micromonospora echinofusca]MBO4204790.1 hypothetical protein [Micromonospora echinofusca]